VRKLPTLFYVSLGLLRHRQRLMTGTTKDTTMELALPPDGAPHYGDLLRTLPKKERRGSRPRCILLTDGPKEAVATRLSSLGAPFASVDPRLDRWNPRGFVEPHEAKSVRRRHSCRVNSARPLPPGGLRSGGTRIPRIGTLLPPLRSTGSRACYWWRQRLTVPNSGRTARPTRVGKRITPAFKRRVETQALR